MSGAASLGIIANSIVAAILHGDIDEAINLADDALTLRLSVMRTQHGRHIVGCNAVALGQVIEAVAVAASGADIDTQRAAVDACHRAATRSKARSLASRPTAPAA